MKKYIFLLMSVMTVLVLSGCSSSSDYNDDEKRYHLVNQDEFGISDIEYTCDQRTTHYTDGSGGFYFYPGDDCGLKLDITVDSTENELYIENNDGDGVNGIYYECESGTFGHTQSYNNRDGHFEFDNVDESDVCTFQL
jgi:hypothetical protein